MADNPRIDELRRRVDKDPTSIAFAQLAEEYRRVGDFEQAVKVCREGLARHPGYLSAQVTLGRALMELEQYEEAGQELEAVLRAAPDNLAAIRALADIHQRRGDVPDIARGPERSAPQVTEPQVTEPQASEPVEQKVEMPQPIELPPIEVAPLEVAPLEETPPVDLWLDATMPTFEDVTEPAAPAATAFGFPAEPRPLGGEDVPSLEALDSLTLDLPPMPDFSNFSLDTDFALDFPEPTFPEAPFDQLEATPETAHDDPVIEELRQWLAAIVADRSESR
jgi:hypothetical protein